MVEEDGVQSETFALGEALDILFVIDDSSTGNQTAFVPEAGRFISGLERLGVDYFIAVTATERGGTAGPFKRVEPTMSRILTPDLAIDRGQALSGIWNVGGSGGASEIVFGAMYEALGSDLVEGLNAGFRRHAADLLVAFVTDEPEQSQASVEFFGDFIASVAGERNRVGVAAIDGGETGCRGVRAAPRIGRFGRRFRFVRGSRCDVDYGPIIDEMVERLVEQLSSYAPKQKPRPETLEVFVGDLRMRGPGEPGLQEWSYDEERGRVIFPAFAAPRRGESIRIDYVPRCSD